VLVTGPKALHIQVPTTAFCPLELCVGMAFGDQEYSLLGSRNTLTWIKTPCFMEIPCLSIVTLTGTTEFFHFSPRALATTGVHMLLIETCNLDMTVPSNEFLIANG
ncbi:hypothetical protein STEG23_032920, partial [Scotinomys teguina]